MTADPLELLDAAVKGFKGEKRDGQRDLTTAVADAMRLGHHLVAEAPTGSGKSLAYLTAAVASKRKVVIATSTIALQQQLVTKDLPALLKHGGTKFTFALLKGRANYICRAKLHAAGSPDALFDQPVVRAFDKQLEKLQTFTNKTETGDRADVNVVIADSTWAACSCTSTECPGRTHCEYGEECFAELARDRAQGVDILVVNHALYCADLAAHGNILPPHDVVIIDEAHAFADNATNAFGADISADALTRLSGMLAKAGVDSELVDALAASAKALGAIVEKREGRIDTARDDQLMEALHAAAERLAAANAKLAKSDADTTKRTAQLAVGRLEVLRRLGTPGEDDVVWIEKIRNSRRIRTAPVVVGGLLDAMLLQTRPVIAVSATRGGEVPFTDFATQMGFDPVEEPGTWGDKDTPAIGRGYVPLQASSSFDWKDQGLLYVANDLPDPRNANEAWVRKAGERLCKLVNAAGGRALVLCTSRANVDRFAEVLRKQTTHDIHAQGDADVGKLTRSFIADETSVLVGTRSFWAGIDAPGVSCLLVVIDRIPFPPLSDPLHAARQARAERMGLNAFQAVDLPAAALVLAQGSGRLIRRRTDRGVVAVLDSRLANQSYRKQLLTAIPPLRRTIDPDEACDFLKDATKRVPRGPAPEQEKDALTKAGTVADGAILSAKDMTKIRNAVSCPDCNAAVSERCRDAGGFTMAFLHDARIEQMHE